MKQFSYLLTVIGFFVIMLCFPKETFNGATNGLLLWFQIILPTLLPFLFLSNILIQTNCVSCISRTLKPFLQTLFKVSSDSCYAIFVGFLCGYPMGAKVIADLILTKRISKEEGQYLLSFCNNTSPMFITSYIIIQQFKNESLLLGSLVILYLSPILCSFVFRILYKNRVLNISNHSSNLSFSFDFRVFDDSIMNGFETITKVGGYIILFSVLFSFCSKLSLFDYCLPLLEISNGIPKILKLTNDLTITFPYVLGLTSFGGFCAIMQTYSMIKDTGLRIVPYIIQKLITASVTSLLAYMYINF